MSKTVFCILTNIFTKKLIEKILKIKRELKSADLWVLYDGHETIKQLEEINIFYINKKQMEDLKISPKDNNYRKNCERFLLYFYIYHQEYSYYYFMENDVIYLGNYEFFVNNYIDNTSDVLIQNNVNYYDGKKLPNNFVELFDGYHHENKKNSIENAFPDCIREMRIYDKIAKDYPYKQIYQFYRLSNNFLLTYMNLIINDNINGHFEWAYTASILFHNFKYDFFKENMYTFFTSSIERLNFVLNYINCKNIFIHNKAVL